MAKERAKNKSEAAEVEGPPRNSQELKGTLRRRLETQGEASMGVGTWPQN